MVFTELVAKRLSFSMDFPHLRASVVLARGSLCGRVGISMTKSRQVEPNGAAVGLDAWLFKGILGVVKFPDKRYGIDHCFLSHHAALPAKFKVYFCLASAVETPILQMVPTSCSPICNKRVLESASVSKMGLFDTLCDYLSKHSTFTVPGIVLDNPHRIQELWPALIDQLSCTHIDRQH